jgi:hypothetical protein
MKEKYYIIIIFGLIIILLYNQKYIKEDMIDVSGNITSEKVKITDAINRIYNIDIEKIRNLARTAYILENGGKVNINGNTVIKQPFEGNLNVLGNINIGTNNKWTMTSSPDIFKIKPFTENSTFGLQINKNNYSYIIPSGTIIAWNDKNVPDGWLLCDGKDDKTPDLRNRFIIGASANKQFKDNGGTNSVLLTEKQIRGHSHKLEHNIKNNVVPDGFLMNISGGSSSTMGCTTRCEGNFNAYVYGGYGANPYNAIKTSIEKYIKATTIIDSKIPQISLPLLPPFVSLFYIMKI